MESWAFYFLLFAFCVFFAAQAESTGKKAFVYPIVFCLSVVAGVRASTVGIDTQTYFDISFRPIYEGADWAYGEPGFKAVIFFLGKIWQKENLALLAFAAITNGLILLRLWDFRELGSFKWMVFAYYASCYFITFNAMRQFLAVSLVFYGTRYIKQQRYWVYCLFNLVALTFHTTAALGIAYLVLELLFARYLRNVEKLNGLVLLTAVGVVLLVGVALYAPSMIFQAAHKVQDRLSSASIQIGAMQPLKFVALLACLLCVYRDPLMNFTVGELLKGGRALSPQEERKLVRVNTLSMREVLAARKRGDDAFALENAQVARKERAYDTVSTFTYFFASVLLAFAAYVFYDGIRFSWYFCLFECVGIGILIKRAKNHSWAWFWAFLLVYTFVYAMAVNAQGQMPYRVA